ncbi:MAG: hypothetical protein M3540_00435 [Actinomycetota bacterium]|nr:hypothetical protein [Actinomycetota bacterium]
MDLSDHRNFRRTIAGAAMIGAPLVFVLAELLHAEFQTEAAKQLTAVSDNTGRWYAAHVLVLLGLALVVPAFLGLVHLLGRGRAALGHLSLVAFVPGLVAIAAIAGMELVLWQMAQPSANRDEMVALAERVNESAGTAVVFLVALLFPLAWLLIGIGLYRARTVPSWAAALIALAQPVGFVSELAGGPKALAVAAQLAFALGLIPVGIRVLRQSDADWEPERPIVPTPATV